MRCPLNEYCSAAAWRIASDVMHSLSARLTHSEPPHWQSLQWIINSFDVAIMRSFYGPMSKLVLASGSAIHISGFWWHNNNNNRQEPRRSLRSVPAMLSVGSCIFKDGQHHMGAKKLNELEVLPKNQGSLSHSLNPLEYNPLNSHCEQRTNLPCIWIQSINRPNLLWRFSTAEVLYVAIQTVNSWIETQKRWNVIDLMTCKTVLDDSVELPPNCRLYV